MWSSLKDRILAGYSNSRAWRTPRRLVVFESDDWGAIRMPDRRAYQQLLRAGVRVSESRYNQLDCLESRDDLELLFGLLASHRDQAGRPAAFTFNTVMGNPDFDAIERDNLENYYHQHFFDSYRQYHGEDLRPLWRSARSEGVIQPQYHGREHLNVPLWMHDLQEGRTETCAAFKHRFYGLTTRTSSRRQTTYLAALWAESSSHLEYARAAMVEGTGVFAETFGHESKTFVPPNFILPAALEPTLAQSGVGLIQGQRGQFVPDPFTGGGRVRRSFTGQRSRHGLAYSVRNVRFEPFQDDQLDWTAAALREIADAFRFRTPAIVSSHRANYVGGISETHRDRSLRLLDELLSALLTSWPDAEFITSDQLLLTMEAAR